MDGDLKPAHCSLRGIITLIITIFSYYLPNEFHLLEQIFDAEISISDMMENDLFFGWF